MTSPLRTAIERDGQRYFDEPVYVEISRAQPLALAVSDALAMVDRHGRRIGTRIVPVIHELSHYQRVRLRWIGPDGKPKDPKRAA